LLILATLIAFVGFGNQIPSFLALFIASTTLTVVVASLSIATSVKSIVTNVKILKHEVSGVENEEIGVEVAIEVLFPKVLSVAGVGLESDAGISYVKHNVVVNDNMYKLKVFVKGYVGFHKVKMLTITFRDIFKLFRVVARIRLSNPVTVQIVPMKKPSRFKMDIVMPSEIVYEAFTSRRRGMGINILGVREYVAGDDFRRIAWKATAKARRLMVKEFEGMSFKNIVIVASIHYGHFIGDPPPVSYIASAILSIVSVACERNMGVRLGVATEDSIKISDFVVRKGAENIYSLFSLIEWPETLAEPRGYSSSNRIVRWFVKQIVFDTCREPCIVALFIDPMDDLDVENIVKLYKELRIYGHELKVFLTPSTLLRFLFNKRLSTQELNNVMREVTRSGFIARKIHRVLGVYAPSEYVV